MASGKKCFTVKWSIENFSFLWENRGKLHHSPEFLVKTLESTKWRLRLHPKKGPTVDYISLTLLREVEDGGPKRIDLYYELSFLTRDGIPVKSKEFTQNFANESVSLSEVYLKKDDVFENNKNELLPQDILTVCCKMWKRGDSVPKEGHCFLKTIVEVHRQTYDGVIEKLSTLLPSGWMRTVYFTSVSSEILFLPFNVYVKEGIVYIQKSKSLYDFSKLYAVNLFIVDSSGNKIHCEQELKWKSAYDTKTIPLSISMSVKDLFDNKGQFLPNDVLTLQYEEASSTGAKTEKIDYEYEACLEIPPVIPDVKKNISMPKLKSVNTSERQLSEKKISGIVQRPASALSTFKSDMKTLYSDCLFSDTVLRVDTVEFPVHRSILSARSPVFKSMFSTDMKEKADKCVMISDLSSDTVRRMLLFVYTDLIEELDLNSAKELYFAADKYDIISLKHRCAVCMQQNLCPSNACEVLVVADMHQDDDLKSAVYDYIQKNDKKVFASDEWKLFMETNSYLAVHVMHNRYIKN